MARILVEAFDGLIEGRIVNVPAGTELTAVVGGDAIIAAGAATFEFEEEDRETVETLVAAWRMISATRTGVKLISFVAQVGVGGGGDPAPWPVRVSADVATVITDADLHGFVIVPDTGVAKSVTLAGALGFDVSVLYVSFGGPPSSELLTLTGAAIGSGTLTSPNWSHLTHVAGPGVWLSDAPPPPTPYSTFAAWTPTLTPGSGNAVTPDTDEYLYTRVGPAGSSGAPATGDLVTLHGQFSVVVDALALLDVTISDLPVPVGGTYVGGIVSANWPAEFGDILVSRTTSDEIRINASAASTPGITLLVDFQLYYRAGVA